MDKSNLKRYVQAFKNSSIKDLYGCYKKPSERKLQAFNDHVYQADVQMRTLRALRPTRSYFKETRITSFNRNYFTVVTAIYNSYNDDVAYYISTPSGNYNYNDLDYSSNSH